MSALTSVAAGCGAPWSVGESVGRLPGGRGWPGPGEGPAGQGGGKADDGARSRTGARLNTHYAKIPGFEGALHPRSCRTPPGAAVYQKRTKGLYLGNGAVNAM